MEFELINPATGEFIAHHEVMSRKTVDMILRRVHTAFLSWRRTDFTYRSQGLKKIGKLLEERKILYAELMTKEMGKPITQAIAEIEKCIGVCNFYAEQAEGFLSPQSIQTGKQRSYVAFEPLGVIFAIMPWNFPFWQVFRFLAPTLMAGNTCLLKHSPNVTGCALAIEEVVRDSIEDEDIFRTLILDNDSASLVIESSYVKAVTLTASTRAGRAVGAKAGACLKKTVLELGGSDPYIILEDADLEKAVTACVTSRLINSGQSCVAAKRFIVMDVILEKFQKMFVAQMGAKKIGDPFLKDTDIGPIARFDLRDELHRQVIQSVKDGARLLLGGELPQGSGAFYPVTVLGDVKKGVLAYKDELFGPVASIIPVKNEQEAIEVANDSPYGLGSAIFSEDIQKAENIAKNHIEAGCCFVNSFVRSDPCLPFGGIKESGYGRELSSFGIQEFVNIKTIYIA